MSIAPEMRAPTRRDSYARVWRWHFFAGLWVAPFGVVLALSGSVYLFNPQIERAIQAHMDDGREVATAPLSPDALAAAARAHVGGAELRRYRLPAADHATVQVEVAARPGEAQLVWVDRGTGEVAYSMQRSSHPMELAKRVHGELLAGEVGTTLVELAACWMIVLLATGAYLAWPSGRGWLAALRPRLDWGRRAGLRSFHVATGLWIGVFAMVFLFSGLPWTNVFGTGLGKVQDWAGAKGPEQEFRVTLQSAPPADPNARELSLAAIVERASAARLAAPVEISPPGGASGVFTVRSMTQYRPDRVTIHYNRFTGGELMRVTFADQPAFKKALAIGVTFHEGALFGAANQLMGALVALGVVALCITGPCLWWKRRPRGEWAIPAPPAGAAIGWGPWAVLVPVAVLLPLVGASLVLVWAAERAWNALSRRRQLALDA